MDCHNRLGFPVDDSYNKCSQSTSANSRKQDVYEGRRAPLEVFRGGSQRSTTSEACCEACEGCTTCEGCSTCAACAACASGRLRLCAACAACASGFPWRVSTQELDFYDQCNKEHDLFNKRFDRRETTPGLELDFDDHCNKENDLSSKGFDRHETTPGPELDFYDHCIKENDLLRLRLRWAHAILHV